MVKLVTIIAACVIIGIALITLLVAKEEIKRLNWLIEKYTETCNNLLSKMYETQSLYEKEITKRLSTENLNHCCEEKI